MRNLKAYCAIPYSSWHGFDSDQIGLVIISGNIASGSYWRDLAA